MSLKLRYLRIPTSFHGVLLSCCSTFDKYVCLSFIIFFSFDKKYYLCHRFCELVIRTEDAGAGSLCITQLPSSRPACSHLSLLFLPTSIPISTPSSNFSLLNRILVLFGSWENRAHPNPSKCSRTRTSNYQNPCSLESTWMIKRLFFLFSL